jgi:flagellar basal-body rod protein FlgG
MMRALYTAASGMMAEQRNTDNIAHNIANVNTTGFKKSRIEFQDLFYQTLREAGTPITQGASIPVPLQIGLGVKTSAEQKIFAQGNLTTSDNQYDVAIEGNGFFQIKMPNGEIGYTRDGSFKIDKEGSVVNSNGYYLEPALTIPSDTMSVNITEDGVVSVNLPNQVEPQEIGQFTLVRFVNPAGLNRIGNNLYVETAASGPAVEGQPALEGFGALQQNYLEASNVQVVEEMVNLIVAQRAYEVNSKAIQTSDDMLGVANNLKQ